MARDPLFSVCYLLVSKKHRGAYDGQQLRVKAFNRKPKPGPGQYVLQLRLFVPPKCLEQVSGFIDVRASETPDPVVELGP